MMICFEAGDVTFNYRAAGIINRGDEVLLQMMDGEDFWCLPGGRVELLESGEEATRRELHEELGLEAGAGLKPARPRCLAGCASVPHSVACK